MKNPEKVFPALIQMKRHSKKHKRPNTSSLCSQCLILEREEFVFPEKNFQAKGCQCKDRGCHCEKKGCQCDKDACRCRPIVKIGPMIKFSTADLDNSDGTPTKFINAFPTGENPRSTNALYGWDLAPPPRPQKTVSLAFDAPDMPNVGDVNMIEVDVHFFVTKSAPNFTDSGTVEFCARLFGPRGDEVFGSTVPASYEGIGRILNVSDADLKIPGQEFKAYTARVRLDRTKAMRPKLQANDSLDLLIDLDTGSKYTGMVYVDGIDVQFEHTDTQP